MMKKILIILIPLFISLSAAAKIPEGDPFVGLRPGPDGRIDILTVFAHQDDESIYEGGTLVKMLKDPRVHLHILCLTFDQTSEAKTTLHITPDHIGRIRVKELEIAAAVYGADDVTQFEYHSRTLPQANEEEVIKRIKEVIDKTGAQIVITHEPNGLTDHRDHKACSRLATEAFKRSKAQVLLYPTLPPVRYHISMLLAGPKIFVKTTRPDFKVNIKDEKMLKRMACYAHASQMKFTSVGFLTGLFLLQNDEYFTVAAKK